MFGLEMVNPIRQPCQLPCSHTKIIKRVERSAKSCNNSGFSWPGAHNKSLCISSLPLCTELEAILFRIITIYNMEHVRHLIVWHLMCLLPATTRYNAFIHHGIIKALQLITMSIMPHTFLWSSYVIIYSYGIIHVVIVALQFIALFKIHLWRPCVYWPMILRHSYHVIMHSYDIMHIVIFTYEKTLPVIAVFIMHL